MVHSLFRPSFLALLCVPLLAITLVAFPASAEPSPEEQTEITETQPEAETVARNPEDIEAEPGINALGESIDYYSIASQAIDAYQYESLSYKLEEETTIEETTPSIDDIWSQDASLQSIKAVSGHETLKAGNNPELPESKSYKLDLDGTEYFAWFPNQAGLVVTSDGHIYNETSNNITGVISSSLTGVRLNSYNDTVTISPLLNASGNNNAYRYGSRVYVTHYYTSGSSLYNDVTYINNAVAIKSPGAGYGFSRYQIIMLFGVLLVACSLLLRGSKK